jgi:hypothetical protein
MTFNNQTFDPPKSVQVVHEYTALDDDELTLTLGMKLLLLKSFADGEMMICYMLLMFVLSVNLF